MKKFNGKFGFSAIAVGAFALALGLTACGGDNGANGSDGADGVSCELSVAEDSSYYKITCGRNSIKVPLSTVPIYDGSGDRENGNGGSESQEQGTSDSLKPKGYVQFDKDVYSLPNSSPSIYLYDDDNLNDYAYVTVYSAKNSEGIKVRLNRYRDYFYGSFEMSVVNGDSKTLEIENCKKIGVAYYDSSSETTRVDSAMVVFSEIGLSPTLSFGNNVYEDYEDKAVITLTDYFLTSQSFAKVRVWSDSDEKGKELALYPTSGGLVRHVRIGFVEFTKDKNDETGALYVNDGDCIYAEYMSDYTQKKGNASAQWGSGSIGLTDSDYDSVGVVPLARALQSVSKSEKVVIVLSHAEREALTGRESPLTEDGIWQAQHVGSSLPTGMHFSFGYPDYTRAEQTAKYIALAHGQDTASLDYEIISEIWGGWFIKDRDILYSYNVTNSYVQLSQWVYEGVYADAFYDLNERAQEAINTILTRDYASMDSAKIFISSSDFVMPMMAAVSNKKVDYRVKNGKRWWCNYLVGIVIVVNRNNEIRAIPVKGLDSAVE